MNEGRTKSQAFGSWSLSDTVSGIVIITHVQNHIFLSLCAFVIRKRSNASLLSATRAPNM
jgi:hypothetical protein